MEEEERILKEGGTKRNRDCKIKGRDKGRWVRGLWKERRRGKAEKEGKY